MNNYTPNELIVNINFNIIRQISTNYDIAVAIPLDNTSLIKSIHNFINILESNIIYIYTFFCG